jgi:N-glycosylase/DNA lyase
MKFEIAKPDFFDLDVTMESEQCPASFFFWRRETGKKYCHLCKHIRDYYLLVLTQAKDRLLVQLIPEKGKRLNPQIRRHAEKLIAFQFRFQDDFELITEQIRKWDCIHKLLQVAPGLRLMQDENLFARICDSICSQNTSIAHLNRMMSNLAARFGDRVEFADCQIFYTPPTLERVARARLLELHRCSLGYRSGYLLQSARILLADPTRLASCVKVSKFDAESKIRSLPGVGPKVGALILMFGFGRTDVFAVDTWVHRGLSSLFGWEGTLEQLRIRAEAEFGEYSAFINNYIFYALRTGLVQTAN